MLFPLQLSQSESHDLQRRQAVVCVKLCKFVIG